MKIFLDANILVSIITVEYPFYIYSVRILDLRKPEFEVTTSAVCIAIAYYFACKKFGNIDSKRRLALLSNKLTILNSGPDEVWKTFNNKSVVDVEDGIQYYTAIAAGCTCIVTENVKDFYYSNIEVMSSRMFLEKYLLFN